MSRFHDLTMNAITGEPLAFEKYKGEPCLVVNVASRCGLTPQYEGLKQLQDSGAVTVLGFPCNQFGAQEPGTNEEILEFATSRYGCNFQLFEKVEVNGSDACELYGHLKSEQSQPDGEGEIAWNFTKFLVSGDGDVVARYEPGVKPEDIAADIPKRV